MSTRISQFYSDLVPFFKHCTIPILPVGFIWIFSTLQVEIPNAVLFVCVYLEIKSPCDVWSKVFYGQNLTPESSEPNSYPVISINTGTVHVWDDKLFTRKTVSDPSHDVRPPHLPSFPYSNIFSASQSEKEREILHQGSLSTIDKIS